MPEKAILKRQRRLSSIWIVPGLALLIGVWMVFDAIFFADPLIEIRFETADGIVPDKTKVKVRNIDIGMVEEVSLDDDYTEVIVSARIDRKSMGMLREDTVFWVARPRIGLGRITGVDTLLSGTYIVLSPGQGKSGHRKYVGLESVPMTPDSAEGLHLGLYSEDSGSIRTGAPIIYRGRSVGQVDRVEFDLEDNRFNYSIFVHAPYSSLVNSSTRFWKASAFRLEASSSGFSVNASSIESLMSGGIAFDMPETSEPGDLAVENDVYFLYETREQINLYPYRRYAEYLLMFNSSVRGLRAGAPVEYRGIQVGQVEDVSFRYLPSGELFAEGEIPVPALIRLYPGYLDMGDTTEGVARLKEIMEVHVKEGLMATLQRGNLLTGGLYVGLDFFSPEEGSSIVKGEQFEILPTHPAGVELIERKVIAILEKIEGLPLEGLLDELKKTLTETRTVLEKSEGLVEGLDVLVASDEVRELPGLLDEALAAFEAAMRGLSPESDLYDELEGVARSARASLLELQRVLQNLERKPNALIFSKPEKQDPEPKASK